MSGNDDKMGELRLVKIRTGWALQVASRSRRSRRRGANHGMRAACCD